MILRLSTLVLAFLILAGYEELKSQPQNHYGGFDLVDKAENIRKPSDFRDRYPALGNVRGARSEKKPDACHLRIPGHR